MCGREVVEGQKRLSILGQLLDRLGILVTELGDETIDCGFGVPAGFRLVDVMQRSLGRPVEPFG